MTPTKSGRFGHPHRCAACGRPSWCTHNDRGKVIVCGLRCRLTLLWRALA